MRHGAKGGFCAAKKRRRVSRTGRGEITITITIRMGIVAATLLRNRNRNRDLNLPIPLRPEPGRMQNLDTGTEVGTPEAMARVFPRS